MKRFILPLFSVPVRASVARRVQLFFLFLLLTPGSYVSAKPQPAKAPEVQTDSEAKKRKLNRERLMAKAKKRAVVVPLTPEQKRRDIAQKRAERAKNREMLAMHSRWKPGNLGGSETLWKDVQEDMQQEMATAKRLSPKTTAKLRTVLHRLESQLGKPYLWGGVSPRDGFDCSGLVFYAFNHVLERKLPRTANGMYQDNNLKSIHQSRLKQGDLIFFNINQRPGADHVGVYLGDGRFIEAPRTGLNIRISELSDKFWQSHYLGARRVLTDDAAL
ncbi:MAG: C40 family peptidase [Kluyvera sp.]